MMSVELENSLGLETFPMFSKKSRDDVDNDAFDFNKRINMNDHLHKEEERLKTFHNWPLNFIDERKLAATGMFYTGKDDKVKCFFCGVEIGQWETTDHPVHEHIRWSPSCPLLRRRQTCNIPIDCREVENLLPTLSYDICGVNEISNPVSYLLPMIEQEFVPPVNCRPEYPDYALENDRLRTFSDWPRDKKQRPEQLAEAGFFYTHVGDRVICYSCGGGLKDWAVNDDPWEQHAFWLKNCLYLDLIKGQSFIESVNEKLSRKAAASGATDEVTINNAANQQTIHDRNEPAEKETTTINNDNNSQQLSSSSSSTSSSAPSTNADDNKAEPASLAASNAPANANTNTNNNATATAAPPKKSYNGILEEKLCKVCYGAEYNTAFLPCGHVVACAKCASSVTKCPLCRNDYTGVMRVYFS